MHARSGTDTIIEYTTPFIDLTAQHGATRRGLTLDMIMDLTVIHMSNHDMAILTIEHKKLSLRLRGSGDPNNDSKFNDIGTIPQGMDPGTWNPDHCSNSRCTYPRGHEGLCLLRRHTLKGISETEKVPTSG